MKDETLDMIFDMGRGGRCAPQAGTISAALDAKYTALQAAEDRPWKIGPSNMAGCLRLAAFMLAGEKGDPISPETARVFELGHQRGARLEELAKEVWPDARSQVPVRIPLGKFTMQGTADLWIPSLRTLVDFKTVGAYGAGLLASEGPSEEYQLQVHAYRDALARSEQPMWTDAGKAYVAQLKSAGLGDMSADDAEKIRAVIVYEAKDSDARKGVKAGQLIECEVPWTEELEERYQTRLREIEGLLIRQESGTLDPYAVPGLPKSSWKCREKDGKFPYCAIGAKRGRCHE